MLDLKSKLAAAGLVTQEDVDRIDKGKAAKKKPRRDHGGGGKGGSAGAGRGGAPRLAFAKLRSQSKGEQYDAVRRFMERARLDDPGRPPTEQAQTFHFATAKGQVGRLVLEPEILGWVQDGTAGVVAYMSNHGLAHAVVPAAAARELAELFPLWLRVLKGHPGAGRLEAEVEAASEGSPA
ncbi:hypothetical protein [Paraliomyxa miuraensis]|uniref:hypothetical protein n=1 Tax=Paraliomyxa miuraensis TaxID=376150 RepID=UPI0022574B8A|nr:hypothetical protein [Paraliomyxa miuraensis]MCX4245091.1 hypothetical protein [Paraliomyxa miuraensis]